MPNASPFDPRPPRRSPGPRAPGRVPRRGLAALVLTATATALLFSFKTPSEMFAGGSAVAFTAGVGSSTTTKPPMLPQGTEPRPVFASATEPPVTRSPAKTPVATGPPATAPPPTEAPPTMPPATEPPAAQVIAGQVVRTPYGPVQVSLTIDASGIADVQALQLPYDRSYSARISQVVEPILREEALQAQSADINLISGATYTSTGYAMSLQSALDLGLASMVAPAA